MSEQKEHNPDIADTKLLVLLCVEILLFATSASPLRTAG